jgi:hypothetical protein
VTWKKEKWRDKESWLFPWSQLKVGWSQTPRHFVRERDEPNNKCTAYTKRKLLYK